MISVSKAVIEENKKFLLLKRSESSASFPGLWDFPGGKDNPGETPAQSVVREVKEETNITITAHTELHSTQYKEHGWNLVFHFFRAQRAAQLITLSADHSEHAWFTRSEIASLQVHPAVTLFFKP